MRARISRFFGIIRMYVEVGIPYHTPHFHARYQDDVGIFGIDPIELLAGSLQRRQRRLVGAWAELHESELKEGWGELQGGRFPQPIEPLR